MFDSPILIIDDDADFISAHSSTLTAAGFHVIFAMSADDAHTMIAAHKPKVALIDLSHPEGHGREFLNRLRSDGSPPADHGQSQTPPPHTFGLIGSSHQMRHLRETINLVAGSSAPVFITGESGTGKAQCAEAIHRLSNAKDGPFVTLTCSNIQEEVLESALRGSATVGGLGQGDDTNASTLFLDDICDLAPAAQARLLAFLKAREAAPLDGASPTAKNVRIISAASCDVEKHLETGALRPDLYFRLSVIPVHMPPLRERGQDVIEIADAMMIRFCERELRPTRSLSPEAQDLLAAYPWPGNVRELKNVLWTLVVVSDGVNIKAHHLPAKIRFADDKPDLHTMDTLNGLQMANIFDGKSLAEIERYAVERAITSANGSVPQAARALNVSPSTLYRKLETWGQSVRGSKHGD